MRLCSAAMLEDLDGHDHIEHSGRVERANLSADQQTSTRREPCSELLQGCQGDVEADDAIPAASSGMKFLPLPHPM